jgi:hypothetical protein
VIDFFQGELSFLFLISISLHNSRTVSGFFLLTNDDSFNVFGLLKSILELDFFYQLQNLDTVIHSEIRHQSREIDTKYFFNRQNIL